MNSLFLAIIGFVVFIYLFKIQDNSDYIPNQQEIQDLSYIDKTKLINDYPYPQISRKYKQLSKGELPFPLNNDSEVFPDGDKSLRIVRNTQTPDNMNKKRLYLPEFYRKDRLSGNTQGTEELRPFYSDKEDSEQSWTDVNVSEHPKFYNSDIKDELTNIGSFFDKNNQYNDKSSANSESLVTDSCYMNKSGEYFCEDNTRLQLIPPKLITDTNKCYALNKVGVYKDINNKDNDINDRVMNGGNFYEGVKASLKNNESFSSPFKLESGYCDF